MPPVLAAIHRDLHLNESGVALLTALPVLLLAVAAVPGSLLISRIGARRALIGGLFLVAAAGVLRVVGPSTTVMLAMTFLMGLGISLIQPTFPTMVRQWFPSQIARATAVYANGLLLGEIIPTALTAALVLPLLGGSWQGSLVFWTLPVWLAAVLILLTTPHIQPDATAARARWWPEWRSGRLWLLGLIFGSASMLYWATNAFIPDYLKATGRESLVAVSLALVNLGQLPSSLLVGFLPRLIGRKSVFYAVGGGITVSVAGFLALPGAWIAVFSAAIGFCAGLVLVLALALPAMLTDADDVHRLSAGMFTITYTCSFTGPIVAGALWDVTHVPITAFLPAALAGPLLLLLTARLSLPGDEAVKLRSTPPSPAA